MSFGAGSRIESSAGRNTEEERAKTSRAQHLNQDVHLKRRTGTRMQADNRQRGKQVSGKANKETVGKSEASRWKS